MKNVSNVLECLCQADLLLEMSMPAFKMRHDVFSYVQEKTSKLEQ